MLVAQCAQPGQKSGRRDIHAALALLGLDENAAGVFVDQFFGGFEIAIRDRFEPGCKRAEAFFIFLGRRKRYSGNHAAVEILIINDDFLFAIGNTFFIAVITGQLDSRFDRLDTAVFGQGLVAVGAESEAKLRDELGDSFKEQG